MRLQLLAGALALVGSSAAFSDSTPWVLLSTSALPNDPRAGEIQTSAAVTRFTKNVLAECSTDRYLLVSQPGLNAADLKTSSGCTVPHLCQAVDDAGVKGKYIVSEVVGETTKAGLAEYIQSACSQKGKAVSVDEVNLAPLTTNRANTLADNNDILSQALEPVFSTGSYTILFIGTPGEKNYQPEFEDPIRMDLKRNVQNHPIRREKNETKPERDTRPLFEKYQFFTPGIFMALITAIVLFSILGVGLRALASLEVSYGAFDKEMGPAAQKKQS